LAANKDNVGVLKTFSSSERYQSDHGMKTMVLVCTIFEDKSFSIHTDDDNPNFQFGGNSEGDINKICAVAYCMNKITARLVGILGEKKLINTK